MTRVKWHPARPSSTTAHLMARFLIHSGVLLLGRGELSADVEDRVLFPIEGLGQDSSQPCLRRIHMDDEGKGEVTVLENG